MATSTMFNMIRDINGYNGFGLMFANDNMQTTLAQNAEQHFTVPSNFANWLAIFSITSGTNVFVANNHTAEVAGATFAASFSQLNPTARYVKAGDVLSFITSSENSYVGVSLYALS